MNKCILSMLFTMLLLLTVSEYSLLFAETYQQTDADGSIHFSDTPPPSGKHPVVQRDNTNLKPSKSQKKTSTTASVGNRQPSKRQPWEPDSACIQELGQWEMKMKNDVNIKKCIDSVMGNIRQKYSPECYKAFETKKYTFTAACQQEMQAVGQTMMTELQQCNQMQTSISSKCRDQIDRYQKNLAVYGEVSQKIDSICNTGKTANLKCYEEHQAEREAACNGMK